jgi:hypothetical protein
MNRVFVVVPPGKEIFVRVGNYRFGPGSYFMDPSFKWPSTYTDGTPINVYEESVPDLGSERPVFSGPVSGSDDSRTDSATVRGDDSVPESSGESEQSKKVRGEPGPSTGFRSGISEDSEVQPFSTEFTQEID